MSINSVTMNNDIDVLSKYVSGATVINKVENPFEGIGIMAGIQMAMPTYYSGKWLYDNRSDYKTAWENLKTKNLQRNQINKTLKGNNIFETFQNLSRYNKLDDWATKYADATDLTYRNGLTEAKEIAKYNKKVAKSDYYKDIRQLIEDAKKLKGPRLKKALKLIERKIAEANLNVHNAKINGNLKAITKTEKALAYVKKYTGMNFVKGKTKTLTATSKTFRTIAKGAKGNVLFSLMSLGFEVPEIVTTYKQLGKKKGNKQLGRTIANTVAETAGFAIGMKAGASAGAAIGAAIGTVVPVIGNAVGAVVGGLIGLGCGFLGGWLAKKGMQKVVGDKSELEKEQQKNVKTIKTKLKTGEINEKDLMNVAKDKLEKDTPENQDAQKALKSYERVIAELEDQENNSSENIASSNSCNKESEFKSESELDKKLRNFHLMA